ncbi:MAG TPA: hypothetical protein VGB97_00290 [Candidatus Paceibacterota bacterium]|jgi:hypothetical protein
MSRGSQSHGVSPKKVRKSPPKTKKRLAIKHERMAARTKRAPR